MKIHTKYIYNHYPLLKKAEIDYYIFCFYRGGDSFKYLAFKIPSLHEPTLSFKTKTINNFQFLYTKYDRHIINLYENTKIYFICG